MATAEAVQPPRVSEQEGTGARILRFLAKTPVHILLIAVGLLCSCRRSGSSSPRSWLPRTSRVRAGGRSSALPASSHSTTTRLCSTTAASWTRS